jgi:hypothetical protein
MRNSKTSTSLGRRAVNALLAGALLLPLAAQVHAAGPIKIGAVVSATGPASFLGDPQQKTLEMYVRKINARPAACSAASSSWCSTTTPATRTRPMPSRAA